MAVEKRAGEREIGLFLLLRGWGVRAGSVHLAAGSAEFVMVGAEALDSFQLRALFPELEGKWRVWIHGDDFIHEIQHGRVIAAHSAGSQFHNHQSLFFERFQSGSGKDFIDVPVSRLEVAGTQGGVHLWAEFRDECHEA